MIHSANAKTTKYKKKRKEKKKEHQWQWLKLVLTPSWMRHKHTADNGEKSEIASKLKLQ